MCIALLSTGHPSYSLILLNNRDEFLSRPTASASWWPDPHAHALGGRDLLRPEHGTWLGLNKQGRIAVLTNFKDDTNPPQGSVSRGAISRAFLIDAHPSTEAFVKQMVGSQTCRDAGGFSLICGKIGEPLAVISNTVSSEAEVPWIHPQSARTVGLSNAAFGDRGWQKVVSGEEKLSELIRDNQGSGKSEDDFVAQLLGLLATDTMPRTIKDGDLSTYINQLRNTILVPPLGRRANQSADPSVVAGGTNPQGSVKSSESVTGSGLYGTQKQTVVLVDRSDRVRFFERTLYDNASNPIPIGQSDVDVIFNLDRTSD